MKHSTFEDSFEKARKEDGTGHMVDHDDPILMVLRHQDVKDMAMDHQTFISGAKPGRIVIPTEEHIRDIRQIPFEMDPPVHTNYRNLLEDWFKRPYQPDYDEKLSAIIEKELHAVMNDDPIEIVHDFSLPLQSKALTLLVNVPETEAEVWISWGTHVFRSEGNPLDDNKANLLYDYLNEQIEAAQANPGEDMYSVLLKCEVSGRPLSKEEINGIMILTFAGGRDTIINAVTNTIAYFADHPESLELIRKDPKLIHKATEELVRYFSPLTHMGRVVSEQAQVCSHAAKKDSRISLCWASANRDESIFESPNEVVLNRSKNPHVAFGFGAHNCLGAHHTRKLMKALILQLVNSFQRIEILEAKENIEEWGKFNRKVGFEKLLVRFHPVES